MSLVKISTMASVFDHSFSLEIVSFSKVLTCDVGKSADVKRCGAEWGAVEVDVDGATDAFGDRLRWSLGRGKKLVVRKAVGRVQFDDVIVCDVI